MKTPLAAAICLSLLALAGQSFGQAQPPPADSDGPHGQPAPAASPPPTGGIFVGYPARRTDPAAVQRGRELFAGQGCESCHAPDIRGSARGPSLLRSQVVQRDRRGELIAPVVRATPPHNANARYAALTAAQLGDIAEFLHSFAINSRDPARMRPATIVTGDAGRGRAYFDRKCAACHSAAGDLKAIGSREPVARSLQQRWLSPPASGTVTATVVSASGERLSGPLVRIDEFLVTVAGADGRPRTFSRTGATVEIHDRLAGHKALLRQYTDQDIHDVTAYLVTLK